MDSPPSSLNPVGFCLFLFFVCLFVCFLFCFLYVGYNIKHKKVEKNACGVCVWGGGGGG